MKHTLWNLCCKLRMWWWARKITKSYYYIERQSKWIDHRTKAEQDDAMRVEIARGLRIAAQRGIDQVSAVASLHHAGHVTLNDTAYIAKIRKALERRVQR